MSAARRLSTVMLRSRRRLLREYFQRRAPASPALGTPYWTRQCAPSARCAQLCGHWTIADTQPHDHRHQRPQGKPFRRVRARRRARWPRDAVQDSWHVSGAERANPSGSEGRPRSVQPTLQFADGTYALPGQSWRCMETQLTSVSRPKTFSSHTRRERDRCERGWRVFGIHWTFWCVWGVRGERREEDT